MDPEACGVNGGSKHRAYEEQEYMVVKAASVESSKDKGKSSRWPRHVNRNHFEASKTSQDAEHVSTSMVWRFRP